MGLLIRILQKLYLFGSRTIQKSLIDDPYDEYHVLLVFLANLLIIIAYLGGFGLILYMLVWAVSLEIFVDALLTAYFLAWSWEQFGKQFTSFEQEMYLIVSTVGYTVLLGAAIQINRMPWADGKTLLVYWAFLLILGFIIWGITVRNNTGLAGDKPGFKIKKIEYKQHFRFTQVAKEIPTIEQVQAYLKRMK